MTSTVLVGGFKPEEIQREFLARKSKEESERIRLKAGGTSDTTNPAGGTIPTPPSSTHDGAFTILQAPEFYRIGTLTRDGKRYIIDVSKNLALDGAEKTQKEWHDWGVANRTNRINVPITRQTPGEWFMGSASLYMAVFQLLCKGYGSSTSRFIVVEQARFDLEAIVGSNDLITSTSVAYYPMGEDDRVYQGYFFDSLVTKHADLTGPIGFFFDPFNQLRYDGICKAVSEHSVSAIKEIFTWLGGKYAGIMRIGNKPEAMESYAVSFTPLVRGGIQLDASYPLDKKAPIIPVRFASIEPINTDGKTGATSSSGASP